MIVKGNLRAARAYLEQFPETAALYQKGAALYQEEHYLAVKLLDGSIMKSWLDCISFGEIGTGGWSNGDGLIHCVRSAYDLEPEDFHEARSPAHHGQSPL